MQIESLQEALEFLNLKVPPHQLEAMERANHTYPMRTNTYFLGLAREKRLEDPILLQVLPSPGELIESPLLSEDPLGEEAHSPVPNLIHRYPDRAVLLVTSRCAVRCRHCNRKRFWREREWTISSQTLQRAADYLRSNPQVREVILSGGDPLTLPPERLGEILELLRTVPSVRVVRVGTRIPVTAPWMITPHLAQVLKDFQPLWINLQFNHPWEITEETAEACRLLREAGSVLGNQTVLLRRVNDSPETIRELCYRLTEIGVRPYYLFQCDLVKGVEHFRTPVRVGIEIMCSMVGHVSGIAVPTFAIDAPGGKGKIPILPNYNLSFEDGKVSFTSYLGEPCWYPEPISET